MGQLVAVPNKVKFKLLSVVATGRGGTAIWKKQNISPDKILNVLFQSQHLPKAYNLAAVSAALKWSLAAVPPDSPWLLIISMSNLSSGS